MSGRQQLLLGVLVLLAMLRLIIVPWVDAQVESADRLAALTMRLDRAAGLVAHRTGLARDEARIARQLDEILAPYPAPASVEALRLAVQRELAATLRAEGLELGLFEWLWEGREEAAGLSYGRVRLQTEGPLRDLARAHVALEHGVGPLRIREAEISMPREGRGPQSHGRASLVLDYYFQPLASEGME
ncbi:MAG: hypothetical protein EA417_00290 [Gammaproteobacteria bacterium]|nr:MAG: hypothetical protein EA417_00290 [Gammaproteobacteria bacterium]